MDVNSSCNLHTEYSSVIEKGYGPKAGMAHATYSARKAVVYCPSIDHVDNMATASKGAQVLELLIVVCQLAQLGRLAHERVNEAQRGRSSRLDFAQF